MLHGAEERSRLESQTVFSVVCLMFFVQFALAAVMTLVMKSAFSLHILQVHYHTEKVTCATRSAVHLHN